MADGTSSKTPTPATDKFLRWPFILLIAGGLLCILGAVFVTPSFVLTHYQTPKGSVDPNSLPLVDQFKIIAAVLGSLMLLGGILIPLNYPAFRRAVAGSHLPCGTVLLLIIGWGALVVINLLLRGAGIETGAAYFFPINLLRPTVNFAGIAYGVVFVGVLVWFVVYKPPTTAGQTWLIGLVLIVLGNLMQGNFDAGFYEPFVKGHDEYYDDALKITSWQEWLGEFNQIQPELLTHSKTHPPFAVLAHYAFLHLPGGLMTLSLSFVFISSTTILLLFKILRLFNVDQERCAQFGLLYSVLPAVNIYYGVSLDGVISTCATLALLGMILLIHAQNLRSGVPLFLLGLCLSNALTFGALFVWCVAVVCACFEWYRFRRCYLVLSLLLAGAIALSAQFLLFHFFHYNHAQAFITASHLENPDGFRGFADPIRFVGTRITDIAELAVFLSLGVVAVLLRRSKSISFDDKRALGADFCAVTACAILLIMFLTGAYKTGETARACMFLYPYLMLLLINESPIVIRSLTHFAGLQTAIMQLFGDYHW